MENVYKIRINIYILYFVFASLLFFSIFLPTAYKEIKIGILYIIAILLLVFLYKNSRYFKIYGNLLLIWFISLSIGNFFIFWGVVNSNPGAISSITVIILWPMLYLLLTGFIHKMQFFDLINKVLIFLSFVIPVYGLYYLLGNAGVIPSNLFINIFPENLLQGVGLYEGYVETSLPNLVSLFFLGPFVLANFMIEKNTKKKIFYGLVFLFIITIALLSGRRALVLILLMSFFIIFFLILGIKNKVIKRQLMHSFIRRSVFSILLIVVSFIGINYFYPINIYTLVERIRLALSFSSSTDPSTVARYEQFFALIEGFSENPLFGQGFGAVASVIRNEAQPWAYELFYVALLFHTGLIGISVYALLTLWIVWQGVKILNNYTNIKYMLPYLAGMISFLLGSASNPYLTKFDYMWVIFIPVMYINYYLLNKHNKRERYNAKQLKHYYS
ncbi:O-antigen ligase family protein [Persephonella sp.]